MVITDELAVWQSRTKVTHHCFLRLSIDCAFCGCAGCVNIRVVITVRINLPVCLYHLFIFFTSWGKVITWRSRPNKGKKRSETAWNNDESAVDTFSSVTATVSSLSTIVLNTKAYYRMNLQTYPYEIANVKLVYIHFQFTQPIFMHANATHPHIQTCQHTCHPHTHTHAYTYTCTQAEKEWTGSMWVLLKI